MTAVLLLSPFSEGREAFYDSDQSVDSLLVLLEDRPDLHPYWRGTAWMFCCADTIRGDSLLESWIEEYPEDPRAWFLLSDLALEDSLPDSALEAATRGLAVFSGWSPEGMPAEEWELYGPPLEANLRFNRCRGFYMRGDRTAALEELSPLLEPGFFPVNDYHTRAPYLYFAGSAALESGDTLSAVRRFMEAAAEGDVRNVWAGRADSLLECMLGDLYMERCRELWGYDGPVFRDASHLLPGPVPGTRHCLGDMNLDGLPDLLAGGTVLLNTGEGFRAVDSLPVNGGVIADLDLDGLPDILGLARQPLVFLQTGDGLFRPGSQWAGLDSVEAQVEGAAVLDWNSDRRPDIYLAVYEDPDTLGLGRPDAFYFGGPDGFSRYDGFRTDTALCGRSVSLADLGGGACILVCNYRLDPNLFWENVGGVPTNTAVARGLAGTEKEGFWGHTIGSAWCDYDGDGDMDVFLANLAHPRFISFSDRSMLLRNDSGVFTDVREDSGIRYEETHSFPVWEDFDGDGRDDLYITSVYPGRRSFLYLNRPGGFADVTWLSGSRIFNGWQVSAADINCDGIPDIIVNEGGFLRLLEGCPGR
jgi:hypothetical protein